MCVFLCSLTCVGPTISKTAGDTDSVQEMAYGESNDHVTRCRWCGVGRARRRLCPLTFSSLCFVSKVSTDAAMQYYLLPKVYLQGRGLTADAKWHAAER